MIRLLRVGTILFGPEFEILHNCGILIEGNKISKIIPLNDPRSVDSDVIIDKLNYVAIPGFIQTHVHLCQTLFRGLADDLNLIEWLKMKIFPLEASHNDSSMYYSAMLGISELIRSGTTTILDMGSINHQEEIIRAISESGLRAFVGKAMMDLNDIYPKLKEPTQTSITSTMQLAERWHNSYDGRIKYAVAPRFVLSCTEKLLQQAHELTKSFDGMLYHTHASENKNEIEAIRKRCKMENIEYLHHIGVLSEKTCLAHCIHLNDNEVKILRDTRTNVAHCPSSNLKLGSGIANVPLLQKVGINVSLGADGAACNNNLNMFQEMRLASLLQKPFYGPSAMNAKDVFKMATINGAKILGLENEIGSIEPGKKADLALLDLQNVWDPIFSIENLFSTIVYSSGPENVDSVMIDGKWVYKDKQFTELDTAKITHECKIELKKLLNRME